MQFRTTYWGKDRSTEVTFKPSEELPPQDRVTACMVIAIHDGRLVMSKPARGWGIIGGHLEPGESVEMCVRREAMEEAAVELGELKLAGHWATRKLFESDENSQYPSEGYQLLFEADVTKVHAFTPQLEIKDRTFVALDRVHEYHHDFDLFEDIWAYWSDAYRR